MNEDEKNLTEIKNNDALVRKLTKMRKWLKAVEISFIFIFLSVILFFWVALYQGPINRLFRNIVFDGVFIILQYISMITGWICLASRVDKNFQYLEKSLQEKFKMYGYFSTVIFMLAVSVQLLFKL